MKYYKRKQVSRLTLFGNDDLNKLVQSSFTVSNNKIEKHFIFDISGLNVELSSNAMMVLESVYIKNKILNTNQDLYTGEIIIRCKNLNNNAMWDSDGKRSKPVLLWNGSSSNFIWSNPSPDILYNYQVQRNILQNNRIELILECTTNLSIFDNTAFNDMSLSFVIYDYDVEEVNTMSEIDFTRMFYGRGTHR